MKYAVISLILLSITAQAGSSQKIARSAVDPHASPPAAEATAPTADALRYCEVVLVRRRGLSFEAEVWSTQGLSDCPAEAWEALDADTIESETGALGVVMNGPRYRLGGPAPGSPSTSPERRRFGELEMRLLATMAVNPRRGARPVPYRETTAQRSTTATYRAGQQIYLLTSPEGAVYVMRSMSQIVDPELTTGDLATLAARLELPPGWTYQARTLDEERLLMADGEVIVVQDELRNLYQRVTGSGW